MPARPRRRSSSGPRSGSRGSSGCGMRSSSAPGRMPRPRSTGSGPTRSGSATRCGRHSRPGSPRSRRPAVTCAPGRSEAEAELDASRARGQAAQPTVLSPPPPPPRGASPAALRAARHRRGDRGSARLRPVRVSPAATADITPSQETHPGTRGTGVVRDCKGTTGHGPRRYGLKDPIRVGDRATTMIDTRTSEGGDPWALRPTLPPRAPTLRAPPGGRRGGGRRCPLRLPSPRS